MKTKCTSGRIWCIKVRMENNITLTLSAFYPIHILLYPHFTSSAFNPIRNFTQSTFYPTRILPYPHFTHSAFYMIRILPNTKPHFACRQCLIATHLSSSEVGNGLNWPKPECTCNAMATSQAQHQRGSTTQ